MNSISVFGLNFEKLQLHRLDFV